ncbi:MAG TPA: cupin domain-containing protein [Acidimicrobiales bacterium]|nr:cupin domain-containing protein [Acidimicrobiales bacterium]
MAPHLWRHAGSFDDVLSLADVDRLIAGAGLRRPAIRLVRDGTVVPPADYTRRARTGGTTISDLIDPGRVLDNFADGATIVLQGLHRWWPPAARFCRDIELVLGHAVQANAYLTPAGAAGLAPHHDTHDVFVLQVAGTKHWTVRRPYLDTPLPRHASDHEVAATQPVLFEADLTGGDALYLPRGVVHSAAAQRGVSLHLTVGVLATTVHDVLRELVDLAAEEVELRRSLTPGWPFDPDLAEGEVKSAIAALADWLATADAGTVAARLRDRFVANRSPLLEGQLLEIAALDEIGDDTHVLRRPGAVTDLRLVPAGGDVPDDGAAPGRLQLVLGDRRVTMPAAVEPAVRRLLDGEPHRVGDLADLLDQPSRRVLVRRLVREGILCTRPAPSDG